MGVRTDGIHISPFGFTTPAEIILAVMVISHLIATCGIFVYWLINHSLFNKRRISIHILGLIFGSIYWQVNQIVLLYGDFQTPIFHWIYGYIVPIEMLFHFYLQLEIVKAFSTTSRLFKPRSVTFIRIFVTIWWFASTGSYLAMLPFLGSPWPYVLEIWFNIGYSGFLVTLIGYDTFQSVYILLSFYKILQNKAELLKSPSIQSKHNTNVDHHATSAGKNNEVKITGWKQLVCLVLMAILIDWTAVSFTIYSFQIPSLKERQMLNSFSSSVAFIHIDLVAFLLYSVRKVKVTYQPSDPFMTTELEVKESNQPDKITVKKTQLENID